MGDQVLFRIPGLQGALAASWEGPYHVKEKLSIVNYRIVNLDGKWARVVHINNTKKYVPHRININSVCVVAEEDEEMCKDKCVLAKESCDGFDQASLDQLLSKTLFCLMTIQGCAELVSARLRLLLVVM